MVTAVAPKFRRDVTPRKEVQEVEIVLEVEKGVVTAAYTDQPFGLSVLVIDHDAEEVGPVEVRDMDTLPDVALRLIQAAEEEQED